jgi:hypothetical protein
MLSWSVDENTCGGRQPTASNVTGGVVASPGVVVDTILQDDVSIRF